MSINLYISVLCLVAGSTHSTKVQKNIDDVTDHLRDFAGQFSFLMIDENRNAAEPKRNMVCSPISIAQVLGMTMAGSSGDTLRQIREQLLQHAVEAYSQENINNIFRKIGKKVISNSKDAATSTVANRAFIERNFNVHQDYITELETNHLAGVDLVNFAEVDQSVDRINAWVQEETKGMIPELVTSDDIDPLTKMILVNAVYFNAQWKTKLRKCGKISFNGNVSVDCIGQKSKFRWRNDHGILQIQLPYESRIDTYMVIVKPNTEAAHRQFLNYEDFKNYFRNGVLAESRGWEYSTVSFKMPKFDLEDSVDAKPILQRMGIVDVFEARAANLSKISTVPLYVSDLKQKAKITVDKKGTKASAATMSNFLARSSGTPTITIDKTFYFFLVRNKHILFFGKVADLPDTK